MRKPPPEPAVKPLFGLVASDSDRKNASHADINKNSGLMRKSRGPEKAFPSRISNVSANGAETAESAIRPIRESLGGRRQGSPSRPRPYLPTDEPLSKSPFSGFHFATFPFPRFFRKRFQSER